MAASPLAEKLMLLAQQALRATTEGRLKWSRTNDLPPEYYASVTDDTAVAIRKTQGVRPAPPRGVGFEDVFATAIGRHTVPSEEFSLILITPPRGEVLSLSSRGLGLDDPNYSLMRNLYEGAQAAGEGVSEAIDKALKALQTA